MVGPDFRPPCPPRVNCYTEAPQPTKTVSVKAAGQAGKSQQINLCQNVPADWWYLFHSPEINQLVQLGFCNSPNLQAAKAALWQARENVTAQIGASLYPNVTAGPGFTRQRYSVQAIGVETAPASIFNLYTMSVNVSYTLDVFGGLRRQIEGLIAQVDYNYFLTEGAFLTLSSNIVTNAITAASLRSQIIATKALIEAQQKQLTIIKKQFRLGGASAANVLTQENLVETTRATLPPLEQNLVATQHALAVLVGLFPCENPMYQFDLDKLVLPTDLPLSLPSCLVRQRPDVRASEALLHAASAQIGVATANLLPQITLTGNYGWQNNIPATLVTYPNNTWLFSASLLQPIFNAGSLRAKRRAAIDAYIQADAQYRQTVLQAFQNVADTLRALEHDAETLRAQKKAELAALRALQLTETQYKLGGTSYLALLTAQQQYQQAVINRIQAQAARYTDTAALYQALGGGWWNGGRCYG